LPEEINAVVDEKKIRQMVRKVVYRTLGREVASRATEGKSLVTEADLRNVPNNSDFQLHSDALISPLAEQVALDRNIRILRQQTPASTSGQASEPSNTSSQTGKVVALGADHGGAAMKDMLLKHLGGLGFQTIDCGTHGTDSVDYPDFAFAVAQLVSQGQAWRGIVIDGAGIGSCMAANKVPGVRAAMCYDQATAVNSRAHNDANVLTLGAGMIGDSLARQIVEVWLETPGGGDRHARRVNKIMDIEKRFLKDQR
jgi:ribose 5-phosphate isomerase B